MNLAGFFFHCLAALGCTELIQRRLPPGRRGLAKSFFSDLDPEAPDVSNGFLKSAKCPRTTPWNAK